MSVSATLHEVQSVVISSTKNLGKVVDRISYCRTLKVRTESGETFELTLFSPDQHALTVREEH